jgi:predicted ATPase/class 3 adenylate cyclase
MRESLVVAPRCIAGTRIMPAYPSGTVAFLFTDIEGSTRRWEHDSSAMAAAVDRHIALLDQAITQHEGVHFKTIGDAVQAAFPTAWQAVAAACTAQLALLLENWGAVEPLRVRMAIHVGTAHPRDGDYLAPALNRLARLLAAGHGGQLLLTRAAADLAHDTLPRGASLHDLGVYHLRDLSEPEPVLQLMHPNLPAEFPPLRSLDYHPNNLPLAATPLIGREDELEALLALLQAPETRLVTLTGPGGAGKTRLALQAARELLLTFLAGVYLVDLTPLSDPDLLAPRIAATLGLSEEGSDDLLPALEHHLRGKPTLLLLDNFEQIVEAAPIVADLLAVIPSLTLLVTSRIPLQIRAEREFSVPTLAVPDPRRSETLEQIASYEAVRLFVDRAQAGRASFSLDERNASAIAAICARLDGLPLAIELAAARVKLLPPHALLARLEHRLSLLTGGPRDLPDRQRTMRDTIAWSHGLLAPAERALFRRLAVFAGGFTAEAAEAIGADDDAGGDGCVVAPWSVFDHLAALCDQSLVRQEDDGGEGDEPRFAMLEMIREYALEQLTASSETARVRQHHAEFFGELAEAAFAGFGGDDQRGWLNRADREKDNFRAALEWHRQVGHAEAGLRLAGALWWFWWVRGYRGEGREFLTWFLTAAPEAPAAVRGRALSGAGALADALGDAEAANHSLAEALALYRAAGDAAGIAKALEGLGRVALDRGDLRRADQLFEEALAAARNAGDRQGVAHSLLALATVDARRGALERAAQRYDESLGLLRALGDQQGVAGAESNLGSVAFLQGDLPRAAALLEAALPIWRDLGDRQAEAVVAGGLGEIARLAGDEQRALAHCRGALASFRELDDRRGAGSVLISLARLTFAEGRPGPALTHLEEGVSLAREVADEETCIQAVEALAEFMLPASPAEAIAWLGASDQRRAELGIPLPAVYRDERERAMAEVRARVGDDAWREPPPSGLQRTLDDTLDAAIDHAREFARPTPSHQ